MADGACARRWRSSRSSAKFTPRPSWRSNLGMVAAIAGRWDEAAEWFGSGRELFLRSGDAIDSALQNKNLGELLLSRGRLNEAEALLTEALRVMRACGWTEGIGAVETQMGQLLIERGALDEADELPVRTAAESTAIGQPQTALEAIVIRAAGRVLAGECELALSMLPSEPGPADEGSAILGPRVALVRALACARLGRLDEARRACRAGREAARAHGLPYEEGLLGRAAMDIARLTDGPADPGAVEAARQLDDLGVVRLPNSYSLSTEDALPCSPLDVPHLVRLDLLQRVIRLTPSLIQQAAGLLAGYGGLVIESQRNLHVLDVAGCARAHRAAG